MAIDPSIANPAGLGYIANALAGRQQMQQQQFQNNLATRDQQMLEQQAALNQNALRTQQTTAAAKMNAEKALSAARIVQMAAQKGQDPKAVAEAISPDFVKDFESQHGAGSWQSLQPQDVLSLAQTLEQHAMVQLGQSPEPKYQEVSAGASLVPIQPNGQIDQSGAYTAPKAEAPASWERKTRNIGSQQQDYDFNPKTREEKLVGSQYARPPTMASQPADTNSVENAAQMIASGQIPMISSYAMRSPWGQAVVSKVRELSPNYSGMTYPTQQAALKAFTTGTEGKTTRSLNVAIAHMGTLSQLSDALQNNDVQALNRISNAWAKETGSAAPTSFNAARDVVANEVVKAITASGGALADRQEAQQTISAAQSPAQLKQVMDTYKQLLGGQLEGLRQQYEQGTGKKDFSRLLSPETLLQLEPQQAAPSQTIHWNDLK